MRPAIINGEQTAAFDLDRPRFDAVLDSISRAIYFHHYHEKWMDRIEILCPDIYLMAPQGAQEINLTLWILARKAEQRLRDERCFGNNQEVFYYQIQRERNPSGFLLRMVFYGGFVTFAVSSLASVGGSDEVAASRHV